MLRLRPIGLTSQGHYQFKLWVEHRAELGFLTLLSGSPAQQRLTRVSNWRQGNPIPEGTYLVGPADVASYDDNGEPDWSARFSPDYPGAIYWDLLVRPRAASRGLNLCIRGSRAIRGNQRNSDLVVQSQAELVKLYRWEQMGLIGLLQVEHGLGQYRPALTTRVPRTQVHLHRKFHPTGY